MALFESLPLWALAISVFCLRIVDVSLGTIRTLAIVQGRIVLSVFLGFIEVFVWITVVAQAIARVHESIVVAIAFAGGFAAGNAVGILLEKRLAIGTAVLRILSPTGGDAIARIIRETGQGVTTFMGQGRNGPVTMVYLSCSRRKIPGFVALAREVDPTLVYAVERAGSWVHGRDVIAHPTGWRAFWKKK